MARKSKEKDITKIFDVAYVPMGCEYWFDKLFAFCMNIFKWENLPDTLPSYEVESNLILTGHCVVFESEGEIITNRSVLYGNDLYLQPTNATTAIINRPNPNLRINNIFKKYGFKGNKSVVFYNSILKEYTLGIKTDSSLLSFIGRYARQLADIESTISIHMVNIRDNYIPTSTDGKTKQSLLEFYKKRENGVRSIVTDSTIVPLIKSIDITGSTYRETLIDLLITKDKILEQFYREIGVKFYNSKKAQVNEEEVSANDDLLLISIDDLYNARIKGAENINAMFGTNISVDFSDTFKKIRNEGLYNGKN